MFMHDQDLSAYHVVAISVLFMTSDQQWYLGCVIQYREAEGDIGLFANFMASSDSAG